MKNTCQYLTRRQARWNAGNQVRSIAIMFVGLTLATQALCAPTASQSLGVDDFETARRITDWIYDADSVRIKATLEVTRTEDAIEADRQEYLRENPGVGEGDLAALLNLQPRGVISIERAWDRKRALSRTVGHSSFEYTYLWDGSRGITRMQVTAYAQDSYGLEAKYPNGIERSFFSWFPWYNTGGHQAPLQTLGANSRAARTKQLQSWDEHGGKFKVIGTVAFDGVDCSLFARERFAMWERYYVDNESRRLRGMRFGSWGVAYRQLAFPLLQESLATKDIAVENWDQLEQALKQMPTAERDAIWHDERLQQLYFEHLNEFDHIWEVALDDWREVTPGKWFPFRQVHHQTRLTTDGAVAPDEMRVLTIDKFSVDEPLSDDVFSVPIAEGADVNDLTQNPPLRYKQKQDRTPEEWAELLAAARNKQAADEEEKQSLDELIGQPAAELPQAGWLNGEPLAWQQLKGRYVNLEFWHIGCGPCWNSIRTMQALHEQRDDLSGVTVIGMHGSGSSAEEIASALEQHGHRDLSYPICLDAEVDPQSEDESFSSRLFAAYRIRRMPYAWLVGPDGKLIAHGDLSVLYAEAQRLMSGAEE